jgi:hypothetical protein
MQGCAPFQAHLGWLINPLLVPVALEVVIKPPPPTRQNGLHDLDNVLRTYLIPRVIEVLKPVSDYAFTIDEEAMKRDAPDMNCSQTRASARVCPGRRHRPSAA